MSPQSFANPKMRFKINEPDVVAESIDGEVILINLNSGAYYSSRGSGNAIWQALAADQSLEATIGLMQRSFDGDSVEIADTVSAFVAELYDEGLIVEANGTTPAQVETTTPVSATGAFEKPILEKYTDMQELLLLDPIHDVDPSIGWPFVKPGE